MTYFAWASDNQAETVYGPRDPKAGKRPCVCVLSSFTSHKAKSAFIVQNLGGTVVVAHTYVCQMKVGLEAWPFNEWVVTFLIGGEA